MKFLKTKKKKKVTIKILKLKRAGLSANETEIKRDS